MFEGIGEVCPRVPRYMVFCCLQMRGRRRVEFADQRRSAAEYTAGLQPTAESNRNSFYNERITSL